MAVKPLDPSTLYSPARPSDLGFETTDALEPLDGFPGQARATEAIQFGIGIHHEGYNLFAVGAPGSGRHSLVRAFLEQEAARVASDADWCYVYNFEQPHRPRALKLPPGQARKFRADMQQLLEDLQGAILAAFETEEYHARQLELEQEFAEKQEEVFNEVRAQAAKRGLAVLRTPAGVAVAPMKEGEVVDLETFKKAPEKEQEQVREAIAELEGELAKIFQQVPLWRRETRRKLQELKQTVTRSAVEALLEELKQKYEALDDIIAHLQAVQDDVIDNAENFRKTKDQGEAIAALGVPLPSTGIGEGWLRRYSVNVLDEARATEGAPVVYETNPTFQNLVGRIEHQTQSGTLVTDFTLIKPGALHRANGGYLILDANRLLTQPYAWEAIKRALQLSEIRTESPDRLLGLISTVSLEPEPIPLNLKVVLVGERRLYYLLCHYDPDVGELFKVEADFDEVTVRNSETSQLYSRLIASVVKRDSLRPLAVSAVARTLEHASRLAGDAERLTASLRALTDLLREADYWAQQDSATVIDATHVQRALDAQTRRQDRIRERLQSEIQRGTVLIDTVGEVVGQVNGLSVLQVGGFAFGNPNRITARVRLGGGHVVDIEREVKLGGPLHSKGVLILSGFLSGRYVTDRALSLAASLVFEQSYGGVDGDSASSAELYALLSALAEVPLRQSLAVTGSVNQHGQVQAIGGVNEKVEGFYDVCKARGLRGDEGVLIPAANTKHLMLRADIVEAARAGQFHIYPIETIDQGIELLTGISAGERDESGEFPPYTVNRRVEDRLATFAEEAMAYQNAPDGPAPSTEDDESE